MPDVKNIVKENCPHIIGLSECELFKTNVDVNLLKIPGYDLLFPKSWDEYGFARVVVYVKKTFRYKQVTELQDSRIQSVWLQGGFLNSKSILFCHTYREHLTGMSVADQNEYMNKFLGQWESAVWFGNVSEPNETHICGDINVDMYQNKWLDPDYPLLNLSRMIKSTCDVNNFYQLVKQVTRVQWNSVSSSMSMSCIDHVYTNSKHRCSEPSVTSFGGSDHDIVSYVRYSKCPPGPSRVIWKRCYKNFDKQTFLEQLSLIDWSDVYHCTDVDSATECFTWKFSSLLNVHAPWLKVQHRKTFVP